MKNQLRKQKTLGSMAASYLLVLMIPMLLTSILYNQAVERISAQQQRQAAGTLTQARDVLDEYVSSANATLLNIVSSSQFADVMALTTSATEDSAYTRYLFSKFLNNTYLDNQRIIEAIHLHFPEIGYVFSFDGQFTKNVYRNASGMTHDQYEALQERLLRQKYYFEYGCAMVPLPNFPLEERPICLLTLPLTGREIRAVAMMVLDSQPMQKLLTSVDTLEDGYVCLLDAAGRIIVGQGNEELAQLADPSAVPANQLHTTLNRGGVRYDVSFVSSDITGWTFGMIVNQNSLVKEARDFRDSMALIILVMFLLGVAMMVMFTHMHVAPLVKLSQIIGLENCTRLGDVQEITQAVERLLDSDKQLHQQMENVALQSREWSELWHSQQDSLRETLLNKLFLAEPESAHGWMAQLENIGLQFPNELFILLVSDTAVNGAALTQPEEDAVQLYALQDLQGRYCQVLNVDGLHLEKVNRWVLTTLSAVSNPMLRCGVSAAHKGAPGLADAYREAVQALNFCHMQEKTFTRYQDVSKANDSYSYPIETEWRLINTICAGNEKQALSEADKLVQANMGKRYLSLSMIRAFMFDIAGTLIKTGELLDMELPASAVRPDHFHTFADFLDNARKLISEMCEYAESKKRSKNPYLKDEIMADVKAMRQDCRLSVAFLAERHSVNASYLSHYFKEQTGQNLLDYINRERVNAACEMLREGKWTINEIACHLGYANDSSFSRVFKKYMNMTPGEYKKRKEMED